MPHAMQHCHRPWWKRPPVWFIAIVALSPLAVFVIEQSEKAPRTPYSVFLDQLEVGNVTSVTFQGTQIDGRYKRPLEGAPSSGPL